MVTWTEQELGLRNLINDLIHLEYDAIAAHDTAIQQLDDPPLRDRLVEFKEDHLNHLRALRNMAASSDINAPDDGDVKPILTPGKGKVTARLRDKAVLEAMKSSEDNTVSAYEQATRHEALGNADREIFRQALSDGIRHREWLTRTASEL